MVNQVHKYKDRDIRRVVKAARAAGIAIARLEVNPSSGLISVVAEPAGDEQGADSNEVETWISKHAT